MDDKRFDHLVKLIGRGASRRSILKGLLGLGGAAVTGTAISDDSDARGPVTRTRIPPPPPPVCSTGQQLCGGTTAAFCCPTGRCFNGVCCPTAGTSRCGTGCCVTGQCTTDGDCCAANQDACGPICCPDGTCGRDGNVAVCCASPDLRTTSGECCDSALQRCDTDCCPDETVCLTRVFEEGPFVEEETCCPEALTCDEQCCDGECFDPEGGVSTAQVFNPDFECCPAGGTVCEGSDGTLCCQGDTPRCCVGEDGVAVCIAADACCTDDDCPGECGACYEGQCVEDGEACDECEVCYQGQCISTCDECEFCDGGDCLPCGGEAGGVCCDGVCNLDSECCDDLHCVELLANVDPGCVICYQGECTILGDGSGGPDCDFEGAAGTCCFGQCIDANDDCATCMAFGESCFTGPLPCCEGLFCDPLLDFTCVRRCQVCDQQGNNCVPADDETGCVLDNFTSGTCCSGVCIESDTCPTTTTTAAPTTTTTSTTTTPTTTTTVAPTTTTSQPTTTTTMAPCTPPITPGEEPTLANACLVDDECCEGSFCCGDYCLPNGLCCDAEEVNPCEICNACFFGLCGPDPFQDDTFCSPGGQTQLCCGGVCCEAGQCCPGAPTISEISIAAIPMCTTPGVCPDGALGDECGAGVIEPFCGTVIPGECPCATGVCDVVLGFCCLPDGVGSVCGTNDALCCSGVCNSRGYCGCVEEGSECSTGDTCCAGGTYACNGFACTQF